MSRGSGAPLAAPAIEALGDAAVLVRFGEEADGCHLRRVHALDAALARATPAWLIDRVPAYASIALFFDAAALPPGQDPLDSVGAWVRAALAEPPDRRATAPRRIEIEVRYGGAEGPDLAAVAQHARLAPDEVVARHCAAEYVVAMLGFAPGFPYLSGLDPALATPRLAQPRSRVEAGSVAIGGTQTGVYPRAGPGGWHVIGRTDARLFDPAREPPSLLLPGDRVRFVPWRERA